MQQEHLQADILISQYQRIAEQLVRVSPQLNDIVQDQLSIIGHLTPQNMFRIDQAAHTVFIANGLLQLKFHPPTADKKNIVQRDFTFRGQKAELLEEFLLHDLYFLTQDLKPQHTLFLRQKVQQFRKLLLEQVFEWVNGQQRVHSFLSHLTLAEAELIDHLMMSADFYSSAILTDSVQHGSELPNTLIQIIQKMCHLEVMSSDEFLPIPLLMECWDDFCFSAAQFLPAPMYRIMALSFEERFNLNELIEYQDDIVLLYRHAQEKSHLLGFVRLMQRELWSRDDLLSKYNFLYSSSTVWQKKVAKLPLFDYSRTVNWLFKQSSDVLDWISSHIQHSSVRVAVTALSFIDTSQVHSQVILATLQYFQQTSARMFIHSCHYYAMQESWFDPENNHSMILKGQKQSLDDQRIAISPSILYLDEWMQLMQSMVQKNDQSVKRIYLRLSRVMQTYMLHLHHISVALPEDLIVYIHPETHQNRDFYGVLQRHKMQLDEFRSQFYLRGHHIRVSIFDSFVRDYLVDYFADNKMISKHVSWMGLFQHAIVWHDQVQKQDIMSQLKKNLAQPLQPMMPEQCIQFLGWSFEELADLDRIIQESKKCHNCLAASYAQRIIEKEYVAFHMASQTGKHHMTLGCYLRDGQLIYDQLEYAHNKKTEYLFVNIALQFISWLNTEYAPFK